jgi:hypothetical protein
VQQFSNSCLHESKSNEAEPQTKVSPDLAQFVSIQVFRNCVPGKISRI